MISVKPMKKQPQYPLLARYICRQLNGRFKNTKTGQWLSDRELERYANVEAKTEQKQEVKLSHESIMERRWDLRMD